MKRTLNKMLIASLILATGVAQAAEQVAVQAPAAGAQAVTGTIPTTQTPAAGTAVKVPSFLSNLWFYKKAAAITVATTYVTWKLLGRVGTDPEKAKELNKQKKELVALKAEIETTVGNASQVARGIALRSNNNGIARKVAAYNTKRANFVAEREAFNKTRLTNRLVTGAKDWVYETAKDLFGDVADTIASGYNAVRSLFIPYSFNSVDELPELDLAGLANIPVAQPAQRDATLGRRARVVRINGEIVNDQA